MFQMLILLSGLAVAQDSDEAPPADTVSHETAGDEEAATDQDIPETDAEVSEEAPEPALSPEQMARITAIEGRLSELGACDIKRKKKQEKCQSEKGTLELELAELTPVSPAEPTATRDMPAMEDAANGAMGAMEGEEGPGEEDGLELDVGDE